MMEKPRTFRVRCEDADCSDLYRFDLVRTSDDGVTYREALASGELPAVIEFTFDPRAFDEGAGILTITQTNDVTHERDDPALHTWDDSHHERTIRLLDTTPPFVLSRRLARDAAATGSVDSSEAGMVRRLNSAARPRF